MLPRLQSLLRAQVKAETLLLLQAARLWAMHFQGTALTALAKG